MNAKGRCTFKSFEELNRYFSKNGLKQHLRQTTRKDKRVQDTAASQSDDRRIFKEAMRDVVPLPGSNRREAAAVRVPRPSRKPVDEEASAIARLEALIQSGVGFVVSQTAEYVEGTGYRVHPALAHRLHRGDFAIQSHIDLHGLGVEKAKERFDRFLADSLRTGKRQILIVHGRGLSSPAQPVLKTRICEWLATGPWRKWVIAFTSARMCDGGTGATYVLLRRRPLTRRFKKKSPSRGWSKA